jgi:hypothetical protein
MKKLFITICILVLAFVFWPEKKTVPLPSQPQAIQLGAGETSDEQVIDLAKQQNEKYSQKDFTGRSLRDAKDLKDMVIYGSCFSQETPDTKVFPDNMTGVTFLNSNLDNVFVPEGNTIIGGIHRKFKVQADLNDWILNDDSTPKEPIMKEEYQRLGISIDPKDLPTKMMTENIIEKKQRELSEIK